MQRKRVLQLFVVFAVFAACGPPAYAQGSGDPVFPPQVSGEYTFRVQTFATLLDSNGVPLVAGAASVGVYNVADPTTILLCQNVTAGDTVQVSVVVPATGSRAELRASAFEAPMCQGQSSEPSPNGAYVYFGGPEPPVLVP